MIKNIGFLMIYGVLDVIRLNSLIIRSKISRRFVLTIIDVPNHIFLNKINVTFFLAPSPPPPFSMVLAPSLE